jgi:hypothetical protein
MGRGPASVARYISFLVLGRVMADWNISERARWILPPVFIIVCAAVSSISEYVGGYTSYVLFGIAIWSIVAVGAKASAGLRKRNSKVGA